MRTCVGCRAKTLAAELLRVVVVDGELVPDLRRRLPGRGAWIHRSPECLRLAQRRRAFSRALRIPRGAQEPDVARLREHLASATQPADPDGGSAPVGTKKQEAGRPVMSQP
jgi:predicted RNA-binding protein YlxR (DUF448 family)